MLMISLFLLIKQNKHATRHLPKKKSVLNLTHELNKNNKFSFSNVLIGTNNNNNFPTSTYKKTLIIPNNNNFR